MTDDDDQKETLSTMALQIGNVCENISKVREMKAPMLFFRILSSCFVQQLLLPFVKTQYIQGGYYFQDLSAQLCIVGQVT